MNGNKNGLIVIGDKPQHDEGLRIWLQEHIEKNPHLTTTVLASATHIGAGVSRTTLDAYLNCTYFLPKPEGLGVKTSKIEDKIRAYRDRVDGVREGKTVPFVETGSWLQFKHACFTAINENAIVVVYGRPGIGKSRYLREYGYQKQKVVPLQVLCSANITPKYFVESIAKQLRIEHKFSIPTLEGMISDKLQKYPRPLFVDQANYLNEKALGTVCYLWETARIPIVLIGTADLFELFTTSQLTEDVRAQLSSRVAMHYPLVELTDKEVKSIVHNLLGDEATDERVAQIIRLTQNNFRHLSFLLPRIQDIKARQAEKLKTGEVSLDDVIETAGARLMVA